MTIAVAPEAVTDCNCSVCRKLGVLWAYYPLGAVEILGLERTAAYVRSDGSEPGDLAFHHCRACGCATHWSALKPGSDRMGVNARLMAPDVLASARVRRLDGADTWTYFDEA